MTSIITASIASAAMLFASTAGAFADFPERPITMIVPYAAGGGTDAIARAIAAGLQEELGQPVNVVNRTGGGGVIGHAEVVNGNPDGYTIGLATGEITTFYWAGTAAFTYADVVPIARVNVDPAAFHVSASGPWKDMRTALADIKAAPVGTYKLSGVPLGAAFHLAVAGLLTRDGIDPKAITVVPSQGAAPGLQELASGGVHIVPNGLAEGKAMVDGGKVKALAVFSANRVLAFPDVPTVQQATGIDFADGSWRGVIAPKGLNEEARKRLEEATAKVAQGEVFTKFMVDRGFGLAFQPAAEFGTFMAEQHKRNGDLMGALGLRQRN